MIRHRPIKACTTILLMSPTSDLDKDKFAILSHLRLQAALSDRLVGNSKLEEQTHRGGDTFRAGSKKPIYKRRITGEVFADF